MQPLRIEITDRDGEVFQCDLVERNGEVEAWIGQSHEELSLVEGGPDPGWSPSETEGPAYELWMRYVNQFA